MRLHVILLTKHTTLAGLRYTEHELGLHIILSVLSNLTGPPCVGAHDQRIDCLFNGETVASDVMHTREQMLEALRLQPED